MPLNYENPGFNWPIQSKMWTFDGHKKIMYLLISTMTIELLIDFTVGNLSWSSNKPKLWLAWIDKSPTLSTRCPPRSQDILKSANFPTKDTRAADMIEELTNSISWLLQYLRPAAERHVVTFRRLIRRWIWRTIRIRCIKKNHRFNKLQCKQPSTITPRLVRIKLQEIRKFI